MKLWLTKNRDVSIRQQLTAQIEIGIASGDLKPGEKLPSTRELARRFNIHPNTVSASYRTLVDNGFLENRRGSGIYIADRHERAERPRLAELFDDFVGRATSCGYSNSEVEDYLRSALSDRSPAQILIVESDTALRQILVAEISAAAGVPTRGVAFDVFARIIVPEDTLIAAMVDEKPKLYPTLPAGHAAIFLNWNSVPESLAGNKRPRSDELVAIVTGWERFLALARMYLLAADIEQEMIVSRLTTSRSWRRSLDRTSLIICDAFAARKLDQHDPRVRVFPLLSSSSVMQVANAVSPSARYSRR